MSALTATWHGFVASTLPAHESSLNAPRWRTFSSAAQFRSQRLPNRIVEKTRIVSQQPLFVCRTSQKAMFARPSALHAKRALLCKPCKAENKISDAGWESTAGSVGIGILWAALAVYGFILSPNQTPYRDMYFLEKLLGLGADDGVKINIVFSNLCFLMGVWPAIYSSLLLPTAKSGNKVPAWPFVVGSFAFGIFALGPFFALWTPIKDDHLGRHGPPKKSELTGWKSWGVQATELPVTSWLLLASACWFVFRAGTAGGAQWAAYSKLFDESRFCHVTTIDFLALTASAPVWMWNDAEVRQWDGRKNLLPVLACIPLLGPALYLALRPKAS